MHSTAVVGVFDEVDEMAGREPFLAQHRAGAHREPDPVETTGVEPDRFGRHEPAT